MKMKTDKIHFFIPILKKRFSSVRNRLWKYIDIGDLSMHGYKTFADEDTFKSRLNALLGVFAPPILECISLEEKSVILKSASQALQHNFDLLGSGLTKLDPIDWHVDFKCGKKWDKKYYREIRSIKGADIKVPWELSRGQHLLWLGEAYLLTDEKKYAKEIVDEINWWIDDNPFMYSVNWTCAMDVGFRAVNWMFALNMISKSDYLNATFVDKVSHSLWQHAFFIRNNLENAIPYSNNHYAADIVSLLYLGAFFKWTTKGEKWYRFALNEYYRETLRQVLPSGAHYERSISYHRMMTEMLSYPQYMLRRLEEKIPEKVVERVGNMYDFIYAYTKPNGLSPLIADNDDGRFIPFVSRDFRNHSYLNEKKSIENRFVSAGMGVLFSSASQKQGLFKDVGVAIVRRGNNYMFINNGGYSKCPKESDTFIATHTHNDLLSFELCIKGADFLVDAGTYLYTSSEKDRNSFRSTTKHNTVVVDDEEQNGFPMAFALKRNVHVGELMEDKNGVYRGNYTTIDGLMNHCRIFESKDEEIVIKDILKKKGQGHEAKLYFHLAEGVDALIENNAIKTNQGVSISFNIDPLNIEICDDTISPSYGVLINSKTIEVTYCFDNEAIFVSRIKW